VAQKRTHYSEEQRIKILQNDEYVVSFSKISVTCSGCQKQIKLDDRKGAKYYLSFWVKHKKGCSGVAKGMVRYSPGLQSCGLLISSSIQTAASRRIQEAATRALREILDS
jgi:hypothetical protein